MKKIPRAILWGLGIGYGVQFLIAKAAGYTFWQSLIPSEALRLRFMMDPGDPFAKEIAQTASTPADAANLVKLRFNYAFSADVYGRETIPSLAQMRTVAAGGQLRGDCKSYAVALGSVFLAMGVGFKVHTSFEHVWLEAEKGSRYEIG